MQEQQATQAPSLLARIGLWNAIWLGVFAITMLAAALTWLWPYRSLPTATGREANSTLPWKTDSLRVEKVTGQWNSATGNERMMLRSAYYPMAEIELGESEGSGMLYIIFTDNRGRQAGDTITLYYNKGSFVPRHESNIEVDGNKARVYVETGYDSGSDFELHSIDESDPLWRINLHYRPEGTPDMLPMGYVTIPAKLQ